MRVIDVNFFYFCFTLLFVYSTSFVPRISTVHGFNTPLILFCPLCQYVPLHLVNWYMDCIYHSKSYIKKPLTIFVPILNLHTSSISLLGQQIWLFIHTASTSTSLYCNQSHLLSAFLSNPLFLANTFDFSFIHFLPPSRYSTTSHPYFLHSSLLLTSYSLSTNSSSSLFHFNFNSYTFYLTWYTLFFFLSPWLHAHQMEFVPAHELWLLLVR